MMISERVQSRIGGTPIEDMALQARQAELKRTGSERQTLVAAYLALGYLRGDLTEQEVAEYFGSVKSRPREQADILAQKVVALLGDQIALSGTNDLEYVDDDAWDINTDDFFDP